ncbi:MAG TPA: hypothetical protein VJP80_02240 [Candidatus Saccharimonadales bacterium]|nr:hypothetical protein [Candidatus Saccharimonadales bacterium]
MSREFSDNVFSDINARLRERLGEFLVTHWGFPDGSSLSAAERAAILADGGDLPAATGLEHAVISEPTRRLTDLPPGDIAAVLVRAPDYPPQEEGQL